MQQLLLSVGKLLAASSIVLLCSCADVETGELIGIWQDDDAAFLTCGDSFIVAMALDIREDGEDLRGTLSTGDTDSPFIGTRKGRIIKGDVEDTQEEVSFIANLAYSSGLLKGQFEATEASDCATGGTSKAVYQVTMERLQSKPEP